MKVGKDYLFRVYSGFQLTLFSCRPQIKPSYPSNNSLELVVIHQHPLSPGLHPSDKADHGRNYGPLIIAMKMARIRISAQRFDIYGVVWCSFFMMFS